MRLPGTLKELSKQLADFPGQLTRVTLPTKDGPFVLEFAGASAERAAAAPKADRSEPPDEKTEQRPKIRDTHMLSRKPPDFTWDEPS